MLRKLAFVGAVTVALGMGPVGSAVAAPTSPLPPLGPTCDLQCQVTNTLLGLLLMATGLFETTFVDFS